MNDYCELTHERDCRQFKPRHTAEGMTHCEVCPRWANPPPSFLRYWDTPWDFVKDVLGVLALFAIAYAILHLPLVLK